MNKYTYRILAASIVMALSFGVGAQAKGLKLALPQTLPSQKKLLPPK